MTGHPDSLQKSASKALWQLLDKTRVRVDICATLRLFCYYGQVDHRDVLCGGHSGNVTCWHVPMAVLAMFNVDASLARGQR